MGDQTNPAAPPAAAEPSIPKPRFDALNERMKAAEARTAELEAQLAAHSSTPPPQTETPKPAGAVMPEKPATPPAPAPTQTPAQTSANEKKFELVKQGVPIGAVDEVFTLTSRGYSFDDAMLVAQQRNPAAFGTGNRGYNQQAHAALPPASGRQPAPPPPPDELEQIGAIPDLHKRQDAGVKAAGKIIMAHILRPRS